MGTVSLGGQYDHMLVSSGISGVSYMLANNAWGYRSSYRDHQRITNADGLANFEVAKSLANSTQVMGYPNIWYGCSLFGNTVTPGSFLPLPLSAIPEIYSSWETDQRAVRGSTWNTAYDLWVSSAWPGDNRTGEIMVMLNSPPMPRGATLVQVGGDEFYARHSTMTGPGGPSWSFVQFWYPGQRASVRDLNLTTFVRYAIDRGWVSPTDLLIQIAAGFELWVKGEGLATRSVSIRTGR
jgi:Glycosyl hydrolase family 12